MRSELITGAYKGGSGANRLRKVTELCSMFESLSFDVAAAEIYGQVRAHLEREGRIIGALDLMIAAIALANDLIVVTHDTSAFARVPNLRLEDWR